MKDLLVRHSTWIVFALIGVAVLLGPVTSAVYGQGVQPLADLPPAPALLNPEVLKAPAQACAGPAALVVAMGNAGAQLIRAWKGQPEPTPQPKAAA